MSQTNKSAFLTMLLTNNGLRFGCFQTKSGRESPYFFNSGCFQTGALLAKVADIYAEEIAQHFPSVTNVYGPAYKGIPLAVMISYKLGQRLGREVGYTFNRKEAKTHGDKGVLVGELYQGQERVVIVEDVITGGTSLRESHPLLSSFGVRPMGIVVGVDRQEVGVSGEMAKDEIQALYGCRLESILNIEDIYNELYNKHFCGKVWIDDNMAKQILAYREKYGVQS